MCFLKKVLFNVSNKLLQNLNVSLSFFSVSSVFLYLSLFVCFYLCLVASLSVYLSVFCLFVFIFVCLYSCLLSVCLYLCFSFCLFVSLFVGLSVSLSDFLYYFISVYHFYVSLPFSATAFLFLSASVCDSVSICLMCGMVLSEQL